MISYAIIVKPDLYSVNVTAWGKPTEPITFKLGF